MKTRKQNQGTQNKMEKLRLWQERLAEGDRGFAEEVAKMDEREAIYAGSKAMRPIVRGQKKDEKATHVRNIVFENIESQISAAIPQPKVTPKRKQDEHLAQIIENWIRNELDRQSFETINDLAERTVPIQGGTLFLQEWDNSIATHTEIGAQKTTLIHPKQLVPQPGVYSGIEDMDWVILKMPTTKEDIRRRFGVSVESEGESEPWIRGTGDEAYSDDAVTQYIGYAKNDRGGIDRYCWVNDIELEDLENYQARRLPTCAKCGRVRPMRGQVISNNVSARDRGPRMEDYLAQVQAGRAMAAQIAQGEGEAEEGYLGEVRMQEQEPKPYDGGACPWCGANEWTEREQEYENVILPVKTMAGKQIQGEKPVFDEMGMAVMEPTRIPFYTPNVYPIVLQKSVSVYGQLLGNSDVDAIKDQQNTLNYLEKKIIKRLMAAGSRITLPPKANLKIDPEDGEKWYLTSPADKTYIGLYEFKGNLQYEMAFAEQVYEEARQILGITNAFQGRQDPSATSGKAKEYAAAMTAGRLESKRIMKNAAYAKLFELMFKYQLAYADEPRSVSYKDEKGQTVYEEFNRYDFLEQEEDGQWYWNDGFLFSTDTSTPLAGNREALWQETRTNLQSGAFGDPTSTETLVLFWGKMEMLHYPGAAETKSYLEQKLQREQEQAMQLQQMQMQQQAAQAGTGEAGIPQGMVRQ